MLLRSSLCGASIETMMVLPFLPARNIPVGFSGCFVTASLFLLLSIRKPSSFWPGRRNISEGNSTTPLQTTCFQSHSGSGGMRFYRRAAKPSSLPDLWVRKEVLIPGDSAADDPNSSDTLCNRQPLPALTI